MKPLISSFLAAVIAAPAPAQDPLLRALTAHAQVVCWVQVDALRELVGPQLLLEARRHVHLDFGPEPAGDDSFGRFIQRWGFDPFADVDSVAVIGPPAAPSVIAARTNARADVLLERLQAAGACEPTTHDGVELLRLPAKALAQALGAPPDQANAAEALIVHRMPVDDHTRILLLGQDAAAVATLAAAMRKPRDPAAPPQPPGMRPGCLVFVAVHGPIAEALGDDPRSRVLQKASAVSLQLVEHGGELRLSASIDTGDTKDARQIAAVVNGVKALATLLAPEDTQVPEVLAEAWHRAAARADGKVVTFNVAVASDEVLQALFPRARPQPPAAGDPGK